MRKDASTWFTVVEVPGGTIYLYENDAEPCVGGQPISITSCAVFVPNPSTLEKLLSKYLGWLL